MTFAVDAGRLPLENRTTAAMLRAMPRFIREHPLTLAPSLECPCRAFLFRGEELLVTRDSNIVTDSFGRLTSQSGIEGLRRFGTLDSVPCFAGRWDGELPSWLEARDLRGLHAQLDEASWHLAGVARHLLHWEATHAFCGVCGVRTEQAEVEEARRCPACKYLAYPRIAPSMIVAVTKGDELLLARGRRFALPIFSVLAGFVEPGETLEDCVHREVREEVGLEVRDLRYFGSQPWPFPDALMVAFTASYAGGDIRPDPSEILEAGWFRRDALPNLPARFSIARRLIDWFVQSSV